ncbi:MAG: NAD-dependent protein deacetylase [Thermoanaerobaculia bacterium]
MNDAVSAAGAVERAAAALAGFVSRHGRIAVLTGAGCSTESGIPDYRSPGGAWSRHKPIQFGEFVRSAPARRRYWARSFAGWNRFAAAAPNGAHVALCELEDRGDVVALITQNVDGLHQRAGSRAVIELHGSNHRVICLSCAVVAPREDVQERIRAANDGWAPHEVAIAPDGDAALEPAAVDSFVVPDCARCGGVLKPDVVFFGENVPKERVERSFAAVDVADALLVAGSSLAVFSGFRFVLGARERGKPVAILSIGETRGDAIAELKLEAKCGVVLPEVASLLASRG